MMRILTWNIHGWTTTEGRGNEHAVADIIAASGAAVVALNEAPWPHAGERAGGQPTLEWLAEQLGMTFVFGPWQRWPVHLEMPGGFGNALLARMPIIASANHHLAAGPDASDRGLLEARILLPSGATLSIYVTHLDHSGEETRLAQFRHARQWLVRDRNRPHLLTGDFNAVAAWDYAGREQDLAALGAHPRGANLAGGDAGPRLVAAVEKAGYTDAARLFGKPGGRTFTPADAPLRMDYHFLSGPLLPALTGYGIVEDAAGISDHLPVWAELNLT